MAQEIKAVRERVRVFGEVIDFQFRKNTRGRKIIKRTIEPFDETSGRISFKNRDWIVQRGKEINSEEPDLWTVTGPYENNETEETTES